MAGLRNICRTYGAITVSSGGKTIKHVWDYAAEVSVPESEMPFGGERWRTSEKAKYTALIKQRPHTNGEF